MKLLRRTCLVMDCRSFLSTSQEYVQEADDISPATQDPEDNWSERLLDTRRFLERRETHVTGLVGHLGESCDKAQLGQLWLFQL